MMMYGGRNRQRGLTRYEFLWVSIVFGVLLALALGYYQRLAAESQRFTLQLQARNFAQAATVVRAFWQLKAKPADTVELDGFVYRVNKRGWPLDAHPVAPSAGALGGPKRCERLLFSLIIAPDSATVNLESGTNISAKPDTEGGCRFYGAGASKALYYEYSARDGGVTQVFAN